ncbi:sensor histidine kinase [Microcella sp.]|uniref:sensor histidine kinase n=1 Tax=Microcella sp. TaxID=1913979 RepID=UPI003F71D488
MTAVALPRAVAARITVRGLATAQRVIAAVGSLVASAVVLDVLIARGSAEYAPLGVAPFVGIGLLALVLLWRPGAVTAALYLAGGSVFSVAVPVLALAADPEIDDQGPYLLNRIATAMCLVGAVSGRALSGVVWSTAAFVVAQSSVVVGLALAGSTVTPGIGPVIVFSISLVAYLTLAIAQRQSERQLEPLAFAADDVRDADRRRLLEQRAASVVHDTVLADLAAIARSPGPLSPRASEVLGEHLSVIAASTVAEPTGPSASGSALGDALLELAHEYQWSGVRVDVSGAELVGDEVPSATRHAVVGAARAALDNVVKHAGTDRAELVVGARDGTLTVLVVDDGCGFAAADVADDRLGLRMSIDQRIEAVGGAVRVWSGPDGTTVMVTVPIPIESGAS